LDLIRCKCAPDCDKFIEPFDKFGRPRDYFYGHQNRNRIGAKREDSNHWKGGRVKIHNYWYILMPEHPNANKQGYVAEHIFIMAKKLGRALVAGEVVHHRNRNKEDNRIENLKLTTVYLHPSEHRVDMSGRSCAICDGETWKDSSGRPVWHQYGDEAFICHTCYQLYLPYTCFGDKDISEFGARPRKDMSDRKCLICGGKTQTDTRGYEKWHKYQGGYRCDICYKRDMRERGKIE
jgi:hypothetical protein